MVLKAGVVPLDIFRTSGELDGGVFLIKNKIPSGEFKSIKEGKIVDLFLLTNVCIKYCSLPWNWFCPLVAHIPLQIGTSNCKWWSTMIETGVLLSFFEFLPYACTFFLLCLTLILFCFWQVEGRQESICSIQEDAIGSLHLLLDYSWDNALLTVRLIQAQDLVPHEAGSLADPYCKLCIQPNRKQQVQTKVHKQTLSPEFDEEFLFEVLPEDLPHRTLEILIYDYDQYSKDECLGQCEIPLESVDLSEKAVLWRGVMQYKKREEVRFKKFLISFLFHFDGVHQQFTVISVCRQIKKP